MNGEYAIEVKDLRKNFGAFKAVDGVTFEVKRGEIYGFLGANGAGKSTTIRMLCGLMKPSSGLATVAGFDISKDPEGVKRNIGYMSQKFSLYGDLTADENINFYGGVYGLSKKRIKERREELLELLDLTEKRSSLAASLPRGFQQRLAFACSILHEPKVIFLDEPTGGVDPLQRRNFWDLIYEFSSAGVTVFVTTHFLDEAEFCHRISLIAAGKIVALDAPSGLKRKLSDRAIYEVECSPTALALELMQKQAWAEQVSIFGSSIHLSVKELLEAEEKIRTTLSGEGVAIERIERIEPSLEDVFLHLVEEKR